METCRSNTVRRWALTLLLTSLAPIPFATIANRETGHMGHNYFKSLFAVGFQGMLISAWRFMLFWCRVSRRATT